MSGTLHSHTRLLLRLLANLVVDGNGGHIASKLVSTPIDVQIEMPGSSETNAGL